MQVDLRAGVGRARDVFAAQVGGHPFDSRGEVFHVVGEGRLLCEREGAEEDVAHCAVGGEGHYGVGGAGAIFDGGRGAQARAMEDGMQVS